MSDKFVANNTVKLSGEIVSECRFSHEILGEKFYILDVMSKRMSGNADVLPVMVSERLVDIEKLTVGAFIKIEGQFRSFNKHEESGNRLILSVFAREITVLAEDPIFHENMIALTGYLCKEPVYRKTPLGREIADLLIAVNRPYNKSDYIPSIAWGRNARFASSFIIGESINVRGRIQSREYSKVLDNGTSELRTCYEVSISRINAGSEVAQYEE